MLAPFYGAYMAPRDLAIQDLNWEQLEQASRLHFNAPQRAQLVKTLNDFVMERSKPANPLVPDVRQRLNDIGDYAKTLALWLQDDSPVGTTAMGLGFPIEQVDRATLVRSLRELNFRTKVGLNHLSDLQAKVGRPDRNTALEPLIHAWHRIYRQAGGPRKGCYYKDKYLRTHRGRFLDLLDEALEQAATIVTTTDSREPSPRLCPRRHKQAMERLEKLRRMIHIPRDTLAKRTIDALRKHPS